MNVSKVPHPSVKVAASVVYDNRWHLLEHGDAKWLRLG